ncbi:flagellar type III secretion system pore protein FliP [Chromobacterium vaccinii]|uniref:flagellar type III secretion system pore protein FliP n=1 Tax=Chromobacterium vaccinii TaxID=1108595 RepID=UPI000ADE3A02|nr:flagellar type III secretion system pore protein FliP [Chromobacterium vaccinii]
MKRLQKLMWLLACLPAVADAKGQMVDVALNGAGVSQAVNIVLALTLVALLPGMLVVMTSFTRVIIVLSMLRHAIGMQETPPNVVLIMLAAFLTLLSMGSTFEKLDQQVVTPLYAQHMPASAALKQGGAIMKEYMVSRTREQDMGFVLGIGGKDMPDDAESISLVHVVPAFLLSELRLAFQIGFVIFLPFLLVDIIVSSVLMAMGMMMVPPVSIALPIKILMFVLIDGWTLVARAVLSDSM